MRNLNEKDWIVNKYFGGLGNQMFQYAFGLNLEKNGKTVVADIDWYNDYIETRRDFQLNKVFPSIHLNIDGGVIENLNKQKAERSFVTKVINFLIRSTKICYQEKKIFAYDAHAMKTSKKEVAGYWQHHQYVDNVSNVLKKEFIFTHTNLPAGLKGLYERIKTESNSVFVHVRGGDYLLPNRESEFGNEYIKQYYTCAIEMMKKKLGTPVFFVFTDDRQFADTVLKKEEKMYYVADYMSKSYEDWIDMMLMAQCRHAIIANSTFSWWGAWLIKYQDKIIIAPGKWSKGRNYSAEGICEPDWIRI